MSYFKICGMDYLIPVLGAAIIIIALVWFVKTLFKQANDLYGTLKDGESKINRATSLRNRKKSVDREKPVKHDDRE